MNNQITAKAAAALAVNIFEDFDWDKFAYDEDLYSIQKVDDLADYAEENFADDYISYALRFDSLFTPVSNKTDKIGQYKKTLKEKYIAGNRLSECEREREKLNNSIKYLHSVKNDIFKKLEQAVLRMERCNAPAEVLNQYYVKLKKLKFNLTENFFLLKEFEDMEDITASLIESESAAIKKLMLKGIDAKQVYKEALVKIANADYEKALRLLISIDGFKNSRDMIELCNQMYLYEGTLEICHDLYHIKADSGSEAGYKLYNVVNNQIGSEPILENIKAMLANYGNRLFYLSTLDELCYYDIRTAENTVIDKKGGYTLPAFMSADGSVIYLAQDIRRIISEDKQEADIYNYYNILEVDLLTAKIHTVRREVSELCGYKDNNLFFKYYKKNLDASGKVTGYNPDSLNFINCDSHKEQVIASENVTLKAITDNGDVVYIKGQGENIDLYSKNIIKKTYIVLLERNIYQFVTVNGNSVLYYVGSPANRLLFSINTDGTERINICRNLKSFEGIYDNSIFAVCENEKFVEELCAFDFTAKKRNFVSKNFKTLAGVSYGNIFYIDKSNWLCKAKIEADFDVKLIPNVDSFIAIIKEYVYFIAVDGYKKIAKEGGKAGETLTVPIKSLYRIRHDGQMLRKLAYDIISAFRYDDNHTDYRFLCPDGTVDVFRIQTTTLSYRQLYKEKHITYDDDILKK